MRDEKISTFLPVVPSISAEAEGFRRRYQKLRRRLRGLADISGNIIKVASVLGTVIGVPTGILLLFIYTSAESAPLQPALSLDRLIVLGLVSIPTFLFIILAISFIATSPLVFSWVRNSDLNRLQPDAAKRSYVLDYTPFLGTILYSIISLLNNHFTLNWTAIGIGLGGWSLLQAVHFSRNLVEGKKAWEGILGYLMMTPMTNAIGMMWYFFFIGIILDVFSRVKLDKSIEAIFPQDYVALVVNVIVVFLAAFSIVIHMRLSKLEFKWRLLLPTLIAPFLLVMFVYPGVPAIIASVLRAIGSGGGVPVYLVATKNDAETKTIQGCLILDTGEKIIIRETSSTPECSRVGPYLFLQNIGAPAAPAETILRSDEYQRRPLRMAEGKVDKNP